MHIAYRLVLASVVSLIAGTALSQDEPVPNTDLIDDLPKEAKEAAAKKAQPQGPQTSGVRGKRATSGASPQKSAPANEDKPPVPNTDLIDDLPAEKKRAGQEGAATKRSTVIPDNLADALAHALRANPNILVAEAKVQQAQAELNEVRQSVVHDVTVTFQRWSENKRLTRMPKAIPASQLREAELAVREDEAKLNYLIGVGTDARAAADASDSGHSAGRPMGPGGMMGSGGMGPGGMGPMMGPMGMGPGGMGAGGMSPMGQGMSMMGSGSRKPAPKERAEETSNDLAQLVNLPEKMRRFLASRVDMAFENQPLKDVLEYLKEASNADVDFVILNPEEWEPPEATDDVDMSMYRTVTLRLKQVTIAAALQALVDLHECAFVFRDYGILVLGPGQASGPAGGGGLADSYRAAGTPMIAPPPQFPIGGGMGAMGMGMGDMPGMGGMGRPGMPANPSNETPAEE